MEKSFNPQEYFNDLAIEIIQNFEKANKATTPVLVGTAKENEIRKKLEIIFPSSIGIRTGCIIDVEGHTSKQTDIILYEKDICPVFSINDTPETTYYPCEGVIAVGEVKSTINTKELDDCFEKIASVKRTHRRTLDSICWRGYGNRQGIQGAESERFDQVNNFRDQIFGFILCERFGLSAETLIDKAVEKIKAAESHLVPDVIVSLNDGVLIYLDKNKMSVVNSVKDATGVYLVACPYGNFQFLLTKLDYVIRTGRTVSDLPFYNYITKSSSLGLDGLYQKF